jgi:hypothetical protein
MADFDYDGPADAEPRAFRPHVPPVQLRLKGRDLDVLAALDVLRLVFAVSDVSHLYPGRAGIGHLYLTVTRDYPYSGGPK